MIYDKIIRDLITYIIEENGSKQTSFPVDNEEATKYLIKKLHEEADELKENFCNEELADILEVFYSILEKNNISLNEIEKVREEKKQKRGGFDNNIILFEINGPID